MEIRSQFADDRTVYFKDPKNSTRKIPIPFITEIDKKIIKCLWNQRPQIAKTIPSKRNGGGYNPTS